MKTAYFPWFKSSQKKEVLSIKQLQLHFMSIFFLLFSEAKQNIPHLSLWYFAMKLQIRFFAEIPWKKSLLCGREHLIFPFSIFIKNYSHHISKIPLKEFIAVFWMKILHFIPLVFCKEVTGQIFCRDSPEGIHSCVLENLDHSPRPISSCASSLSCRGSTGICICACICLAQTPIHRNEF